MKKKHVGFGIVGAGVISHFHAKAIKAIANARLIGIFSINKNKSDQFAAEHRCTVFSSLDEMLQVKEIDIICICTPSGLHLDPAIPCIEAGKHCLIEKPLEVTIERCDKIIKAAEKAGVKVGVIFPSRFYENSKKLKEAVDQKRFGDLVLGDAYVKWSRSPEYYQSGKWRGTWQYDGGGALMNQGIHSVDLLQWYMGKVESVRAICANIRHKNIEVEDTVVAILKFANGALGTIESTTAVFPGSLKRIEVLGTGGTAVLEESNLIKWEFLNGRKGDKFIQLSEANLPQGGVSDPTDINFVGHQKQIQNMIDAIQAGIEPLINGLEGRKSVEIVQAVYESARTGFEIQLPLVSTLKI